MKTLLRLIGRILSSVFSLQLSRFTSGILKNIYTGLRYKDFGHWGPDSVIMPPARQLVGLKNVEVGDHCTLGKKLSITAISSFKGQTFTPHIYIGDGCVFGDNNHITCISNITIGKKLLTGSNVLITDNAHGSNELTIEPVERPLASKGPVMIGNNVWLGNNVCVLSGVTIGDGVVVGANSVVTHSLPPYCVAVGVPAKPIKRYINEQDKQ
jgi:acetyltransferase-like isoleucine patch superfamily enzyme